MSSKWPAITSDSLRKDIFHYKKDNKAKCRIVFKFGFAKNGEEKTEEEIKEGKE